MAGIMWESSDKTLLRLNLGRGWTWHFFDTLIDSAFALIQEMPHDVDLIIHDEDLGHQVPHGLPLDHFRRAADILPANVGYVCIVARDRLTHAMIRVLSEFNRNVRDKVCVVNTLEEAQNRILDRHK